MRHTLRPCFWLSSLLVASSFLAAQEEQAAGSEPTAETPAAQNAPATSVSRPANTSESHGSLWPGQPRTIDYFTDLRARRPGDILTIRIVENVRAEQAAETDSSREAEVSLGIAQLFGLQNYAPDNLGLDALLGGSGSQSFRGGGSNTRSNNLSATLSATVVEVTPAGQLIVEASRFMKVNAEEERLTLRGIVRIADVSPTNEVLSTNVANLEVHYGGKGVIGSNLKPGILMRIVRFLF